MNFFSWLQNADGSGGERPNWINKSYVLLFALFSAFSSLSSAGFFHKNSQLCFILPFISGCFIWVKSENLQNNWKHNTDASTASKPLKVKELDMGCRADILAFYVAFATPVVGYLKLGCNQSSFFPQLKAKNLTERWLISWKSLTLINSYIEEAVYNDAGRHLSGCRTGACWHWR